MTTTLYADVLFLINFSMDFISLWASSLLGNRPRKALRMSLAAAVGALYGVVSVILGISGAVAYITAAAFAVIMCMISFGFCGGARGLIRQSALVWICGALLSGIMTAILSFTRNTAVPISQKGSPTVVIAAAAGIVAIAAVRLIKRTKKTQRVTVCVEFHENSATFEALCDSGNLLSDPISGDPVITVSRHAVDSLCGKEATGALCRCDTEEIVKLGLPVRMIPRKTVDKTTLACALVPDKTYIKSSDGTKEVRCLISPADCPRDWFGGCSATVPYELIP